MQNHGAQNSVSSVISLLPPSGVATGGPGHLQSPEKKMVTIKKWKYAICLTSSARKLNFIIWGIAFLPFHLLQTSFLFVVTYVRFLEFLMASSFFTLWLRSSYGTWDHFSLIFNNYCLSLYISSHISLHACVSSKFVINFLYWQRFISMFIDFHLSLFYFLIIFVNQGFCFSLAQFCTFNMISAAFLIVYFKLYHVA